VPLVLVGTPIGNLADLPPRAVTALAAADAICCEDTRRTGRLLEHAGVVRPPLIVVNDHTEVRAIAGVLQRLGRGERVVVVSDAGMPGVSDPGERLVRAAVDAGHPIEVVPGPSAAITALVTSGLPTGRFVFEGFLPRKGSGRTSRLTELATEARTIVLYEAPHRLVRTLTDLVATLGDGRRASIGRELTKLHEEHWRGTLAEALAWASDHQPRGELVVVIDGAPPPAAVDSEHLEAALSAALDRGASPRDAAAAVARDLGVPKRRAYELAVQLRDDRGGQSA
jgi:16S rRNA (cytidine1402-2'-O)-methyltransferase